MADKLTLSNREILKLNEGLCALDGVADKEGKIERFNLDDKLVWNVTKARRIVESAVETYRLARKSVGARHGVVDGMKLTEANAASVALFMEADEKLQAQTNELIGILKLKRSELQAAGVKIPGILSNLYPIITDA